MTSKRGRAGAVRKHGLGRAVGSGGQGRQALEGRGPTPRAEEREHHPAHRAKKRKDMQRAARGASRPARRDSGETVCGRGAVLEALREGVPATALYVSGKMEPDSRTREISKHAGRRGIPILEVMRSELDRLAGEDAVHQGVALQVPAYDYAHPQDLLGRAAKAGERPLIVALDGVTDPRNLGAILRSVAAFGGHGVVIPGRRTVGVTAAAWKSSAGALARIPVARASNLAQTLVEYKKEGVFVVGLAGEGRVSLPRLKLATEPLVLVVGSEGKGISRIVRERCDQLASIPIQDSMQSLNAAVAGGVALYEVSCLRAKAQTAG